MLGTAGRHRHQCIQDHGVKLCKRLWRDLVRVACQCCVEPSPLEGSGDSERHYKYPN